MPYSARRTAATSLGVYSHQDLPFEMLVDELAEERRLAYSPLFQIKLIIDNTPIPDVELSELSLSPLDGTRNYTRGVPCFATSIALLDAGTPVVISDPNSPVAKALTAVAEDIARHVSIAALRQSTVVPINVIG